MPAERSFPGQGLVSLPGVSRFRVSLKFCDDDFRAAIEADTGIKPPWAAEAFSDVNADVRQSIARIKASPFVPHTDAVRGFVFDVATGRLDEVS